nr:iron ABC transporter permease [Amphibacillus cookii]
MMIVFTSLTQGSFQISVSEVVNTLLGFENDPAFKLVVFDFRLPRIVVAILVGFGLGVSGNVLQGMARNEIADPGILGINTGASAAIILFMFFFQGQLTDVGWSGAIMMPLFGWVGGLFTALFIYFFSRKQGQLDPQRLILVGIAISAGLSALILFVSLKMAPQDFEMATIWIRGSVSNANWLNIAMILPWLICCVPLIFHKATVLDLLQLGEEKAMGLGVAVEKEKIILLLSSIGVISASVSISGSLVFVGLIAPHISRQLIGRHHRYSLPVSGLMGMLLVVAADLIAKVIFAPAELPVGIVISIIGVPFFMYLLFKNFNKS